MLHAVSGPDHLAALSPLVLARGRSAWRLGVRWGMGHAAGTWLIAAAALAVRAQLDLSRLGGIGERLVGASLVLVGLWALRRALAGNVHVHRHAHDGVTHVHVHAHRPGSGHAPSPAAHGGRPPAHAHGHAATGIGLLHGFAGGSHLVATLPALALPLGGAAAYLGGFALGSVAAMAGFAGLLGGSSTLLPRRAALAHRWLVAAAGIAALVTGGWWLAGGGG
jgi:hypothetical protein